MTRKIKRFEEDSIAAALDAAGFEVTGGIWATSPVTSTPELMLSNWQVMQLPGGDRHFVGYNMTEYSGRVSSKIVTFDKATMRGITQSGRVYELVGGTGYNGDAAYVWDRWSRINGVSEFTDVSSEL